MTPIDMTADVLVQANGGAKGIVSRDTTVGELLEWSHTRIPDSQAGDGSVLILSIPILPRASLVSRSNQEETKT